MMFEISFPPAGPPPVVLPPPLPVVLLPAPPVVLLPSPAGSSPVTAVMHTTPEISVPALVMNCLAPLIAHSSPSKRARVRVLPASLPASGSVRPNAPSRSPEHSLGSHSRF